MGKHTTTSLFTTGELSLGRAQFLTVNTLPPDLFTARRHTIYAEKPGWNSEVEKYGCSSGWKQRTVRWFCHTTNCRGNNWLHPWSNAKRVETAPKKSSEGGWHPPSFQAISFTVGNNRLQQRKQQNLRNLWPRPSHQLQSKHEQCYHSNRCYTELYFQKFCTTDAKKPI